MIFEKKSSKKSAGYIIGEVTKMPRAVEQAQKAKDLE